MSKPGDNSVLRTVLLDPELDDQLRIAAFREGGPKGELIREAVDAYVAARRESCNR